MADWWSLLNQAELDWSDVAFDQIFKFHEDRRSKFPDVLDEVEKANFGDVDSLMDCWLVIILIAIYWRLYVRVMIIGLLIGIGLVIILIAIYWRLYVRVMVLWWLGLISGGYIDSFS